MSTHYITYPTSAELKARSEREARAEARFELVAGVAAIVLTFLIAVGGLIGCCI